MNESTLEKLRKETREKEFEWKVEVARRKQVEKKRVK
jgi:hypothetical protein